MFYAHGEGLQLQVDGSQSVHGGIDGEQGSGAPQKPPIQL